MPRRSSLARTSGSNRSLALAPRSTRARYSFSRPITSMPLIPYSRPRSPSCAPSRLRSPPGGLISGSFGSQMASAMMSFIFSTSPPAGFRSILWSWANFFSSASVRSGRRPTRPSTSSRAACLLLWRRSKSALSGSCFAALARPLRWLSAWNRRSSVIMSAIWAAARFGKELSLAGAFLSDLCCLKASRRTSIGCPSRAWTMPSRSGMLCRPMMSDSESSLGPRFLAAFLMAGVAFLAGAPSLMVSRIRPTRSPFVDASTSGRSMPSVWAISPSCWLSRRPSHVGASTPSGRLPLRIRSMTPRARATAVSDSVGRTLVGRGALDSFARRCSRT